MERATLALSDVDSPLSTTQEVCRNKRIAIWILLESAFLYHIGEASGAGHKGKDSRAFARTTT